MAFVDIKNGLVEKAFNGGKGFGVSETFKKSDGTDGKAKFKVWFEQPQTIAEGSRIDVSGVLSVKVSSFDGDSGPVQYAEVSLNNARLKGQSDSAAAAPVGDVW